MINPRAILHTDSADVEMKGDIVTDVNRIAVWDWSEITDDDGQSILKCHTCNGDCYINTESVDSIEHLE
jgi:hypothetical protein